MERTDMSDSQFEFEDRYDDDFFDDASGDENNNHDSSDTEVKGRHHNNYETESSDDEAYKVKSPSTPSRKDVAVSGNESKVGRNSKVMHNSVPRRAQSDPRGKKTKTQRNSKPPINKGAAKSKVADGTHPGGHESNAVVKRVISASRNKVKTLHNVIHELQLQVESLTTENRDLKRSAFLQGRELRKLDQTEADLPALIKKHSAEFNVVQEKYKRQKETSLILTENLKKSDNELRKTKDKLKECQTLIKEKNLGERVELKNKIENLEKFNEEKQNKIIELTRYITLQKKTHGRSLKEKNEKYEKATERIKTLEELQVDLLSKLKDRERALQVTNIYSRRIPKDGKQSVVLSQQQPVAPILKKCVEEEVDLMQSFEVKTPENEEKQNVFITNPFEDRVLTMVNIAENVDTSLKDPDESELDILSSRTEKSAVMSVVEEKLERQESEDFYGIGNTDNKNGDNVVNDETAGIADDSEVELHGKLDRISEDFIERDARSNALGNKEMEHSEPKSEISEEQAIEEEVSKRNAELDAQAKKLLLAKMLAIDSGENPDEVTKSLVISPGNDKKTSPKKKPIFLMASPTSSSNSPEEVNSPNVREPYQFDSKPPLPPSKYSAKEIDTPSKKRGRKSSWEFKLTDENLHRGLPAHLDSSPSQASGSDVRYQDDSLDGPLRRGGSTRKNSDLSDTSIDDNSKLNNSGRNSREKENSGHGRFDYHYSPTPLDNGKQGKNKNKKTGFDLFDQFEDPFKASSKPKSKKDISNGMQENFNIKSHHTEVDDDLEEMFII